MATAASFSNPAAKSQPGLTLEAFIKLVRSQPTALDAYLDSTEASFFISSTRTQVHFRHLRHDGSSHPRVKDLCERLAREVIDYAIPRPQFARALEAMIDDGSARHITKLHKKAAALFTDIANTGEGGELLLYLLTESYLRIPQILCKMPLKTSPQMHYHGADGIHGTVDPNTDMLCLYWGESKLYNSASTAIDACLTSLAPFIQSNGGSGAPQRRDLELLTDNLELNDSNLEKAILRYLDPDDVNFNKLQYRGVALVGFDEDVYKKNPPPCREQTIAEEIKESIKSWKKSLLHHIMKHKLDSISIEIFCLPFPSVEAFRDAFLTELGLK